MTNSNPRPNLNPASLPVLALAGRAVITFRNIKTGSHVTIKIKQARAKHDRKIKLNHYHVAISLLGDNDQGMRYAGMMFPKENFRIWIARQVSPNEQLAQVFRWLVKAIQNPESLRGKVHLFHEGRCCKCGQTLTHPESIYTGIGPVCKKNLEKQYAEQNVDISEVFAQV